jgi:hypothetical protein
VHGIEGWSLAPVLIFVAIGAMLVFRPAFMQLTLPRGLHGRARVIFSWIFFKFSLLLAAVGLPGTLREYHRATSDFLEGRYSIVEGPVTDFVPMPYQGHALESFTVSGHRFSHSDVVTAGFRNTASNGGPIREGLYVRITYTGNLILRLEVGQ